MTFLSKDMRYDGTNRTFQTMVGYTGKMRRITPLELSVSGERELNALYFNELQRRERDHYEMIKQLRRKDRGADLDASLVSSVQIASRARNFRLASFSTLPTRSTPRMRSKKRGRSLCALHA